MREVAEQLRAMVASSPRSPEMVAAWTAAAGATLDSVARGFPDITLPAQVIHYVHDADIRVRDLEYAERQDRTMREIIADLERGFVPPSRGTNFSIAIRDLIPIVLIWLQSWERYGSAQPLESAGRTTMKHRTRTRIASAMIGVLLAIGVPQTTHAKRRPPAEVKAVVKDGIRYSAPHFGALHGKVQNGGYVQAQEISSGKLLWDRMVYRVIYDERLERDAQDVFIIRVSVNEGSLLVENELGETFEMDLDTGRCKAVIKKSKRTDIGTEAGSPR